MNNRYTQSLTLWERSNQSIVPASSIIAKDPRLYTYKAYPIYLTEGKGALVKDCDGNRYIDFQSGLGPIILGHAYPAIDRAIQKQLQKGILFSLLNPLQIEFSELICSLIPCAQRIRIFKTGADTTSGAIRIARAYTGKTHIISCHFHGWDDWYYVTEKMNTGIPLQLHNLIHTFTYNDLTSLKKIFDEYKGEIAAVIMEPCQFEVPRDNFLQRVKKLTHENNAVLIFDEVVTGFRFGLGGGQEYFGVTPDLACFSKAIANGMPLGVVTGRKKIMDATIDVITSTTFSEEALSLASAIATIKELQTKPVLKHIWQLGEYFQNQFNDLAKKYEIPITCIGLPPRLMLDFKDYKNSNRLQIKAYFLQESASRGILFGNVIFINYSHTKKQIKQTLAVCEDIFQNMHYISDLDPFMKGDASIELW